MFNRIRSELMFSKAQKLVKKEKYDEAIETFDQVIALNDNYSAVYAHKAIVLADYKDDYKEAAGLLEKALQLKPLSSVYHMYLGRVHYDNQQYDEALKSLKKSRELHSHNTVSLCLENITHLASGQVTESVNELIKNIQHSNGECQSRCLVLCESYLLANSGGVDTYNVTLKKYLENENINLSALMGITYFEAKDYERAESNFMASIETTGNFIGYYYLGLCNIIKNNPKKSRIWFKKALASSITKITVSRLQDMLKLYHDLNK